MNSIIITSINPETESIKKFKNTPNWKLILVGDAKTPEYNDPQIDFIPYKEDGKLSKLIGANKYSRKNLGYIKAIQSGSDIIYETDDDNIPYDFWRFDAGLVCDNILTSSEKFANIYGYLSGEKIWNRGFPLSFINKKINYTLEKSVAKNVGVWQTLIDQDPDVDAIYRMVFNKPCVFNVQTPFILDNNTYAPFNSQSTFWSKDCFPYMYFPSTVPWRFADILRSYITQRLLREDNLYLGFSKSIVYQNRFRDDYMKDFVDEIQMYSDVLKTIEVLDGCCLSGNKIENLNTLYTALVNASIVNKKELEILNQWNIELNIFTKERFILC
jgi:hypothetical protein